MSKSTAIGLVSATLRQLLAEKMRVADVDVTVLAPDEPGSTRRVNLFLYRVEENEYLANQDATVVPGYPARLKPTPLSLNLRYMLTAYASNDAQTGNSAAHAILGDAIRVLWQYAIVPERYLAPGLGGAREQIRITHTTEDPEELTRIWTALSRPLRPAASYLVSTVQIDAVTDEPQLVPARVRRIGVPSVREQTGYPSISGIDPINVGPGDTLTMKGSNLTGWRTAVSIGDTTLDATVATDDAATVTIPAHLGAGIYDLQIDIPPVFRRQFTIEIRP
jgi:Pvc16 N-terminal domain/IPT/TIG domain